MSKTPLTEQDTALDTEEIVQPVYQQPAPPQFTIERQGAQTVPYVRRLPKVRAGVCEFCGVLDNNMPGDKQYKLCPHYRGMELQCSYCDERRNPEEVVASHMLNVAEHPERPGTLIVWCNSFACVEAHNKRFKVSL